MSKTQTMDINGHSLSCKDNNPCITQLDNLAALYFCMFCWSFLQFTVSTFSYFFLFVWSTHRCRYNRILHDCHAGEGFGWLWDQVSFILYLLHKKMPYQVSNITVLVHLFDLFERLILKFICAWNDLPFDQSN